jgi:putative tricarboxylic transport membrane protein
MMALGIPGDVTTAVMLGALLIHDVIPSPTFITEEPILAYSIFIAFFVATFMMIGLQSFMLRIFVLVTRVRMYVLASVILGFCGIGVFAIHNVDFDLWTLFWFGILGFLMRQFGFPLAPMILGVVLGNIAELNLARALAITTELTPFVTRPWSLLFLILAIFSAFFPLYQRHRNTRQWTVVYAPAMAASVSLPMFMMGGVARPLIAIALLILSGYLVWHRVWKRPRSDTSGTS